MSRSCQMSTIASYCFICISILLIIDRVIAVRLVAMRNLQSIDIKIQ